MCVLLDEAREVQKISLTSAGYEIDVKLTSNTDPQVIINTTARVTDHHMAVDPQTGQEITARQLHADVSLSDLEEKNYPLIRPDYSTDEPHMMDDLFEYTNSRGIVRKCRVIDQRPDETYDYIMLFFELME